MDKSAAFNHAINLVFKIIDSGRYSDPQKSSIEDFTKEFKTLTEFLETFDLKKER